MTAVVNPLIQRLTFFIVLVNLAIYSHYKSYISEMFNAPMTKAIEYTSSLGIENAG